MRLNAECSNNQVYALDVQPRMTIEDVIALLTVQNGHLDFDKVVIIYNGKALKRKSTVQECQIIDDCNVRVEESDQGQGGCCMVF